MVRVLKIIALLVVLLVVLIAGLLFVIPYLVNVNGFGPKIVERLEPALGRKVHLGSIRLSLLPLSLVVHKVSISEDPDFGKGDFATVETLRIDISLVALAQQRLEITSLDAVNPWVKVIKNANGAWNTDTLGGVPAAEKAAAEGANAPAKAAGGAVARAEALAVSKLRLLNGTLSLDDLSGPKPSHQEYDGVTASAEHLAAGKPFDFLLALKIGDGVIETSGTAGPLTDATPPSLPMQGHVRLDNVDLVKLSGPDAAAHGLISGIFDIDYNGRLAKLDGQGTIRQLQTSPKGKPAAIPVTAKFQAEYMPLTDNLSVRNMDIQVDQAAAVASAVVNRRLPQSNSYNFKTDNAALADLGKLLPALGVVLPNNSALTSGTLTQSSEFTGPLQPLNGTATINLQNAKLSGYSITEKVAGVARLAGLQTTKDTEIQSLKGTARFANGAATFSDIQAVMPGLTVTGGGAMNTEGQLDLQMQAFFTGGSTGAKVLSALAGSKGVPFSVKGPMNNPQFSPGVGAAGKQQISSIKDLAGKGGGNLGKALGGLLKKKN
jgi:uncharacterized protein involved in outer membrane biogenesis